MADLLPDRMNNRTSYENLKGKTPRTTEGIKIQLNQTLSTRLNKPKQIKPMSTNTKAWFALLGRTIAYVTIPAAFCVAINIVTEKSESQRASEASDVCYEKLGQQSKTCSITNFIQH
jgi:hypothetical protein